MERYDAVKFGYDEKASTCIYATFLSIHMFCASSLIAPDIELALFEASMFVE